MSTTRLRPGATARAAVAAAFLVTMLGATLPTPLYPLYEQRFGFGGLMSTVVFATYAGGVLAALLFLGRLSDQVGRRVMLAAGLALAALSSAAFLVPDSLTALFAGRALSGLSAGIFTGTATAAIVDLAAPDRRERAGLLAAVVNMLGLGLGPVVAGVLAQTAPLPLQLPYLVHLALLVPAAVAVWSMPEPVAVRSGPLRLRPQRLGVPAQVRGMFVRAATAGFASFAVLGLFAAVSPALLGQVLGRDSPLLSGVVVFTLLGSSAVGQVLSARVDERRSLLAGCAGLVVGMALVGTALATASLGLLLAGGVVAGLGQGVTFRAGVAAVGAGAPDAQRGEVVSTFFLVLYLAISFPVIGVGAAGQVFGLVPAGVTFSALVALLAAGAFVSLARSGRGAEPAVTGRRAPADRG